MITEFSEIVKKKYPNNYSYYYDIGKKMISDLLKTEYIDNINEDFIENIMNSNNIKIIFYSHNNKLSIKNNIGIAVYCIIKNSKEIKFYLLLFGINKIYRGVGYGSNFLNTFIDYCKSYNDQSNKSIILHSLLSSYDFYKSLGFEDIIDDKYKYRKLFQYEKYNKEAIILQLYI